MNAVVWKILYRLVGKKVALCAKRNKRAIGIARLRLRVICWLVYYLFRSVMKGIRFSSMDIPPCWKVFM